MANGIILTERDAQRLQRALRWVEDIGIPNARNYRRIRGTPAGKHAVTWFYLTDAAMAPMIGRQYHFDTDPESVTYLDWVESDDAEDVDIYPHPSASVVDYQTGLIAAIKSNGQWVSLDLTNIPPLWCGEENSDSEGVN